MELNNNLVGSNSYKSSSLPTKAGGDQPVLPKAEAPKREVKDLKVEVPTRAELESAYQALENKPQSIVKGQTAFVSFKYNGTLFTRERDLESGEVKYYPDQAELYTPPTPVQAKTGVIVDGSV